MLTREQKKKKTNLYNKKNTEGEEQKNPLCVSDRNHWVQKKNDLSYSRSSDLSIHTGIVKKKGKKKMYKSKTNKQKKKKNKDTFFFAFTFYQTRSGCTTWGSLILFAVQRQSTDELRNAAWCIINEAGCGAGNGGP
jgi:hypothetical protein